MASPTRTKLNEWLSQLDIKGIVLDVGGIANPVEKHTKIWDVKEYKILDIREERKGRKTDFIGDLNIPIVLPMVADVVFCLEVTQFVYNPVGLFINLSYLIQPTGVLYVTFHLSHPPMKDEDYLRYTKKGIKRLLEETGFEIKELLEPINGYFLVEAIPKL